VCGVAKQCAVILPMSRVMRIPAQARYPKGLCRTQCVSGATQGTFKIQAAEAVRTLQATWTQQVFTMVLELVVLKLVVLKLVLKLVALKPMLPPACVHSRFPPKSRHRTTTCATATTGCATTAAKVSARGKPTSSGATCFTASCCQRLFARPWMPERNTRLGCAYDLIIAPCMVTSRSERSCVLGACTVAASSTATLIAFGSTCARAPMNMWSLVGFQLPSLPTPVPPPRLRSTQPCSTSRLTSSLRGPAANASIVRLMCSAFTRAT